MKNYVLTLLALALAVFSTKTFGQTTIVKHSFESSGDTWAISALSTPDCNISSDVWSVETSLSAITPSDGSQFWGMRDIDGNCGGSGYESITFASTNISSYTGVTISFDYYTIGYEAVDNLGYEVWEDGVKVVDDVSLNDNSGGWLTITHNVTASVTNVYLVLKARQNGGSDYAGFDNVILEGTAGGGGPYTVTFDGNGSDSGSMSDQTESSATALDANAYGQTGCTFVEWNTAADGSGTSYADGATFPFSADATLYAQWNCGGGGSCSSIFSDDFSGTLSQWSSTGDWTISTGELKHNLSSTSGSSYIYHDLGGQTLSSSDYEWSFCVRNGNWDPSGSNNFGFYLVSGSLNFVSATAALDGYAVGVNLSGTSDALTLYRVDNGTYTAIVTSGFLWDTNDDVCIRVTRSSAGNWELFYDSGSGEVSGGTNTDVIYTSGQYTGGLFEFTSTRAGLLWFDDVNICKTTPVDYTVSFDANTGSGSMSDQTANTPTALTANTFIKGGCTFVEWNDAANGSGASYADGAIYDFNADVTLYAQWSCSCSHTVTDFYPTSGPVGTEVTIEGTGFTGSSTVSFNGQSATIVSQSATVLVVEVPSGATTGAITVTESACDETTTNFTIIDQSGTCGGGPNGLIISEVYDAGSGSLGYIELYNGTASTIDLTDYEIRRYGTLVQATSTENYRFPALTTIASGQVLYGRVSTDANTASPDFTFINHIGGFNDDDRLELRTISPSAIVDDWHDDNVTGGTGYYYRRNNSVTGPNATYDINEWTDRSGTESTADLGNFTISGGTPNITAQPSDATACSATFSVTATAGGGGGLSYQWYFNDSVSDNWLTVTAGNLPAGLTISGATSNSLTISSNTTSTSAIDGYQFYCQVTESGTCNVASVAAEFTHDPDRYYRSTGTGDWDDLSVWQQATSTGGPWSAACDIPYAGNSDYISIESGNTVTVNIDIVADQIIVQSGGILELVQELLVDNGNAGGADLEVIGTLNDRGTSGNGLDFQNGGTWILDANGTIRKTRSSSVNEYRDNYEGGISNIPATAKWYFLYDGSGTVTTSAIGMFYPNLFIESSSGAYPFDGTTEILRGSSGYCTVKGDLNIGYTNTGSVTFYNNNGNAQPMIVQGDVYIGAGSTFSNEDQGVFSGVPGTGLEVLGDMIIEGTYDFDNNNTGTTILSGSAAQEISSAGAGSFDTRNFEIDNGNGASLDGIDINISNTLTFTDGILSTDVATADMFNITNTATNAIVGGTAQSSNDTYIDGKLQWSTTSGNTYRFPIGSTPVTYGAQGFDITIDAGSGAILGYLEANTTSPIYASAYCDFEDHPGTGFGITIGSGYAGFDGILDQATFNLNSDLQWDITNPSGSVTQYDLTVLATGNQDINPAPHADNLAVSANGVEVRYLMKNGEPGNPGVATTSTLDFPTIGFDMCPTQYSLANLTSFSHFTLDGPTTPSTELPVELTVFEAKKNDKQVDLMWVTESEINVSHFIIERSKNGIEFKPILSENAHGNSTSTINYQTVDYSPLQGKSFYRLQSVDFDGSFEYSQVRAVEFNNGNISVWNDTENWNVNYKSNSDDYLIRIFNNLGQVVKNAHVVQNPESNSVISHHDLPAGVYIMVIEDNGVHHTVKVIK